MKFTIHIPFMSSLLLSSVPCATVSSNTDAYIAALAQLLEQKTIGDAELITILEAAEDGKVVNPISHVRAETSVEHHVANEALKELLQVEIDAARVAAWASDNIKEQDVIRKKRKRTQEKTKELWKNNAVLSAGVRHSCAISINGTVSCWGKNEQGQVSPPPGIFKSVSAGSFHSCGVSLDGTAICWGENVSGECNVPPGVFISVSAEHQQTWGLRIDGSVECWGECDFWTYKPSGAFRSISASSHWKCGVKRDGSVECWHNSNAIASPSGIFQSISTGAEYACGVKSDYSIECWGENQNRQYTAPPGRYLSVVAGSGQSCGLKVDGTVLCWGHIGKGWPIPSPAGTFRAISSRSAHTCGVRMDSSVECWGNNDFKQSSPPESLLVLMPE